jgi:hypothetical protein
MIDFLMLLLLLAGLVFLEAAAIGWLVGEVKRLRSEAKKLRSQIPK